MFQRVQSTTVTGQTFSVRYVERFHFLNLLLLYYSRFVANHVGGILSSAGKVFGVDTLFARYGEEDCLDLDMVDYLRNWHLQLSMDKTMSAIHHLTMEQIEN